MKRQSLTELLKNVDRYPDITGIVDVILRDVHGDIVHHEHKHNLITEQLRSYYTVNANYTTHVQYVFINENTEPMHIKRSAMRTILPGTWSMLVTPSLDGVNRIWTYATVFAAPPATRTFRTVGLSNARDTGGFANITGGLNAIIAATVLSAPITQTTAQTLEVNYRLAFQRN